MHTLVQDKGLERLITLAYTEYLVQQSTVQGGPSIVPVE